MGKSTNIRDIIERVVSASLATHMTALKNELVDNLCERLGKAVPAPSSGSASKGGSVDVLNAAINSILDSSTQVDILSALLQGTSKFAERAALFVIRAGAASGWRATGLDDNEGIKAFTLDLNGGLASRAYQDRTASSASPAEFDAQFFSTYGAPADETNVVMVPLVVRDKVAALLYADAGVQPGGKLDPCALEALAHSAGMWLEITAARKSGASGAEPAAEQEASRAETAEPVYDVAPPQAAAAAAPSFQVPPRTPETPAPAPSALSAQEEEIHRKAKRFAKLLVEEIKLYNQAKVAEGRAKKDLYDRLKDDIDKSRATYDKRYGDTSAASGNYFTQELIRILANEDATLLGSGFSG